MLAEITSCDGPSGDPEGLQGAARVLERWLSALTARARAHPGPAGPVIEAEIGPAAAAGGEILILCHYDTVWPTGTAAQRGFEVRGEIASGPGVLDMRGGIVAAIGAIELTVELEAVKRPVRLLITPDEESGGVASRQTILSRARQASVVLVPEPALPGGKLKTARKGWIVYRLEISGVAAHAGLEPELGASAIDELVDQLAGLRRLADAGDGITLNCGLLSAPNPANVVADRAVVDIDVRLPDDAAEAAVREAFAALAPRRAGVEIAVRELHSRPPFMRTAAVAAAFEQARSLAAMQGFELSEGSAGGVSDANIAAASGVPVLDGLGPEGGGAHAISEHLVIDSLIQRTALIALLATRLNQESLLATRLNQES